MRVLVANEPRSYREAFTAAFQALRPHIESIAVEPEDLEQETIRLRPDLVVCEHITPALEARVRYLMEVRVEDEVLVAMSNVPALFTATNLNLADLLSFLDQCEEMMEQEVSLGR
ncbi:MAG TPA: hypothetical protein VFJ72_05875 [Rubrobacteraceae bacterium]|nr:hypothetical protein [Rubrobacteraceae bacterium]